VKTLELEKASRPLSEYAEGLDSEPLVITSDRKPVAALISLKDVDKESLLLSLDLAFMEIIRRARAEVRRGQVYSLEQVKHEMLTEASAPPKRRTRRRRVSR